MIHPDQTRGGAGAGVATPEGCQGAGRIGTLQIAFVLVAIVAAFVVSSSAALGGSLVLVPALALVLGTKEGAALAALLLAANNVVKMVAYRATIPVRRAAWVVAATVVGALAGSMLLVAAQERVVTIAVIASIVLTMLLDRLHRGTALARTAPLLALGSGFTSGFSGTSGPLKGLALRALRLDRLHTVGAASAVSLFGDVTKTAIYTDAQLLGGSSYQLAAVAVPLMVGSTLLAAASTGGSANGATP
jgi:uncharacterized membrane protein YfcA